LLIRIRDAQDREAWEEFVEIYAPLVFAYARRQGLQDADAADLTQDVLGKVHGAIGRLDYDRQRGKFRGWLLTITRNALRKRWGSVNRQPRGSGDTGMLRLLEELPGTGDSDGTFWQQEYHRCLFRRAAKRIQGEFRSSTWQVFWKTAVEGHPCKQIAESYGMTVGAVYTAKSRVLARLRDEVEQMQGDGLADS
jgi:RNA polymerase sigma-70 factor (ECF subfamily)